MSASSFNENQEAANRDFDLFRLTSSKAAVDVCANTLRTYNKGGLPFYRRGRAVFVSKTELAQYIRNPDRFKSAKSKRAK